LRRFAGLGLLIVVAAGFIALGLGQAWTDSPTFDEPVYVASGLASVLHHDLTLNDEHPPLPKVLAILPVLFVHPVVPNDAGWNQNNERTYSARFVEAQVRSGKLRSVTMASRIIPLLEAVAVAFVLYALGRDLFGRGAGTLAGLLWLLSPFVLGLGHLLSLDVAFALATACWAWTLLRWTRRRTRGAAILVGAASGAAALTDVTGLILAAVAAGVIMVVGWKRSPGAAVGQAVLAAVVAWAAVWVLYAALDFHVLAHPTGVLPWPYIHGIQYLRANDTIPGPGYLLGVAWTGGRWWYWPGSLLVKTVLTTLVLVVLGPLGLRSVDRSTRWRSALVLGLPAVCLVGFTILTPRDIGLRYLLAPLALWLVLASSAVVPLRKHLAGSLAVVLAVLVAGTATALSAPSSLAWAGLPFQPGYLAVTNSDVDWGQGLYQLQHWAQGKNARVAYFGPRGLGVGDVPGAKPLLAADPTGLVGWVAVSATDLTSEHRQQLAWLRGYCSVGDLGGSILLYRFATPPTLRPGPSRPIGRCPSGDAGMSVRIG
jgi:4-amino-4-deoxy-L-arabinose transferase-like glycosyltransferase